MKALKSLVEIDSETSRPWARLLEFLLALNLLIPFAFITSPIGIGEEADSLDYRLPLVRWALAHRAYPNFPWTVVDDYPAFGEILIALVYPIAEWAPRIVSVGGYVAFVFGCIRLGKMVLPRVWALTGALLASTAHLVLIQDNLVMLDNFASSLTLWSGIYLLKAWRDHSPGARNFWKAGFFAGMAAATRYTQFPPVAILSVFAIFGAFRSNVSVVTAVRRGLAFGIPVVLFAAPWLIRNPIVNRNPLFPMAHSIFGGEGLSAARAAEFMGYVEDYGFGTSVKELAILFYRFAFQGNAFDYSPGPLSLALLPWILIGAAASLRKKTSALAMTALFFGFTVVWFYSARQGRFWIHALPFGIFSGFAGMLEWKSRHGMRFFGTLSCLLLGAMGLLGTVKHLRKHEREFPPSLWRIHQKEIPEWLNANSAPGKVLLLSRTSNLFAIRRDFVFAYPHPYATSVYDHRTYSDPVRYWRDLYAEGIRFIYVEDVASIDSLPVVSDNVFELVYRAPMGGFVYALNSI